MSYIFDNIKTPYYVVDESLLEKNLKILRYVKEKSGAKILIAQKAFSMFSVYPLISEYLDGTTASGLFEARLGKEEFGKETHIFSAAYRSDEIDEILAVADHIVFNSISDFDRYSKIAIKKGKTLGIRVNPECSTQVGHEIYDPCGRFSRLGVKKTDFDLEKLKGISGICFHTLCEQNADDLETTLNAFFASFGEALKTMKWVNFGGGHHITREDYDLDLLIELIKKTKKEYNVEVYLEPGEAVALNAGFLVGSVLDIVHNEKDIAILDTSAACHMPDVLEMPYRPNVLNSFKDGESEYSYRFCGNTCLAGDIIGDYSFKERLKVGDKVVFLDMAIYSMVKNNTFNGINLPSIVLKKRDGSVKVVKTFGYDDFRNRLS